VASSRLEVADRESTRSLLVAECLVFTTDVYPALTTGQLCSVVDGNVCRSSVRGKNLLHSWTVRNMHN
jgi:hypothetical protein